MTSGAEVLDRASVHRLLGYSAGLADAWAGFRRGDCSALPAHDSSLFVLHAAWAGERVPEEWWDLSAGELQQLEAGRVWWGGPPSQGWPHDVFDWDRFEDAVSIPSQCELDGATLDALCAVIGEATSEGLGTPCTAIWTGCSAFGSDADQPETPFGLRTHLGELRGIEEGHRVHFKPQNVVAADGSWFWLSDYDSIGTHLTCDASLAQRLFDDPFLECVQAPSAEDFWKPPTTD